MTRALVVYESLFGNACTIARAVADGLSGQLAAEAVDVGCAPPVVGHDVGLLVVGGPSHQFGMPRPDSRRQAATNFGDKAIVRDAGLREWLAAVRLASPPTAAAAFDIRLDHPRFLRRLDHASRTEEKLLVRLGSTLLAPAEQFFVAAATGPLASGELERARRWGRTLATGWAACE